MSSSSHLTYVESKESGLNYCSDCDVGISSKQHPEGSATAMHFSWAGDKSAGLFLTATASYIFMRLESLPVPCRNSRIIITFKFKLPGPAGPGPVPHYTSQASPLSPPLRLGHAGGSIGSAD